MSKIMRGIGVALFGVGSASILICVVGALVISMGLVLLPLALRAWWWLDIHPI